MDVASGLTLNMVVIFITKNYHCAHVNGEQFVANVLLHRPAFNTNSSLKFKYDLY